MMKQMLRKRDIWVFLAALIGAFACMTLIQFISGRIDGVASMVFLLAVFFVSMYTDGYWWGVAASITSVLAVNFAFRTPYFAFNFTIPENIFSGVVMLVVSFMTSTLTTRIKKQEQLRMESETEKMRANLLRAVSHDLRTPLTSIYGACSTVIDNYDSLGREQKVKLLSEACADAQWLNRMVENLLSVTRIDADGVAIQKTPTVLEELVDTVLVRFQKLHPGVPVEVKLPDDFIVIPMDSMLIQQVLTNLLENAVLHAEGMTHLTLRVFTLGRRAVFEVIDNGCGIPKEQLKRLFSGTTLAQDTSSSGRHGMGIGLSVCAAIIKAHGGEIKAESTPGEGTTIRFWLETEEVDTEETNGYQALVAQTCVMGMTMFISYNPDLVILDLGLPDRDGLDAIRSIRQKYLTPIIVLSARTTERDKIEALDLGANDYITKPFGTGELLARVRAALRVNRYGGGSLPGGVFSAQGLTINYERRKVFVDGQEVRLTQTEYNIVAFLSEHAGRVMTYAAIVRAIWGDTDASSTKKLQVNMANIRKKLGSRPGSNTYILNELGVGYRMIEEDTKPLEPAEETK